MAGLRPQINRAVSGGYAPGSTFKVVTASAGLETHSTTPEDRTYCQGVIYIGRWAKRCHKSGGHGSVNLIDAIEQSCDVYFYRLGQRLGPDRIAEYARSRLGETVFAEATRAGQRQDWRELAEITLAS